MNSIDFNAVDDRVQIIIKDKCNYLLEVTYL